MVAQRSNNKLPSNKTFFHVMISFPVLARSDVSYVEIAFYMNDYISSCLKIIIIRLWIDFSSPNFSPNVSPPEIIVPYSSICCFLVFISSYFSRDYRRRIYNWCTQNEKKTNVFLNCLFKKNTVAIFYFALLLLVKLSLLIFLALVFVSVHCF